jgi:decaprenylphospho-beta-D-erythro-pentofuranosid-2-ulose 2-reductase
MKKNVIIYGASSLISLELIKLLNQDISKFFLFCRDKNKIENFLLDNNFEKEKFSIFEVDILDIKKNLELINQMKNIDGVIWVAGFSGNTDEELKSMELAKKNIKINFLNPMLIINKTLTKMTLSTESFLVIVTSVAALRGRGKNLIYGSAKSALLTYLSGLRQKYNQRLTVVSVIPGYIRTKNFKIKAPNF